MPKANLILQILNLRIPAVWCNCVIMRLQNKSGKKGDINQIYILINNVPTDNVKKDSLLLSWDSVKRAQAINPAVLSKIISLTS